MDGIGEVTGVESATVSEAGAAKGRSRLDPRTGKQQFIHDEAFWRTHEARRLANGESIAQYCRVHGLALSTFRRWSSRLSRSMPSSRGVGAGKATFLTVPVHRDGAASIALRVEVTLGRQLGVKLEGEAAARVVALVMSRLEAGA